VFEQSAVLHGTASEVDAAFEQLNRALALRDPSLVCLALRLQWESLRPNRRFSERLKRMFHPYGTEVGLQTHVGGTRRAGTVAAIVARVCRAAGAAENQPE
jgi:hypothetical protein